MSERARPRILIADDREQNRYVLCRILGASGYDCLEARTGTEAIALAQTMPDVIILDVRLPEISGYEVCRRLKQDPRTASISILQISAVFLSPDDRASALEAGADGFLTHPIDRPTLLATVESFLRRRAGGTASSEPAG